MLYIALGIAAIGAVGFYRVTAAGFLDVVSADSTRIRSWLAVVTGASLGAAWGVAARLWMRLISDRPEFSWGGTVFIIGAPTVIGIGIGVSLLSRRNNWRRGAQRAISIGSGVSVILIGVGAGSAMVPTVVFGGLAVSRPRLGRVGRIVVAVAVVGLAILIGSGIGLVSIILGVLAAALLVSGYQPRWVLAAMAIAGVVGVSAIVIDARLPMWRTLAGVVLYIPLVWAFVAAYGRAIAPVDRIPVTTGGLPATAVSLS